MPITYVIENGSIHTRCFGDVRLFEVLDHFRQLEHDPNCSSNLDVLLDLSDMTSLPESGDLRQVADAIARVQSVVKFGACAIVAPRDALYGMLRMFEVYAEDYFRVTRVFRSETEAEAWLTTSARNS
jgi:hypothetical protein